MEKTTDDQHCLAIDHFHDSVATLIKDQNVTSVWSRTWLSTCTSSWLIEQFSASVLVYLTPAERTCSWIAFRFRFFIYTPIIKWLSENVLHPGN